MGIGKDTQRLLDPTEPGSLVAEILPREELEPLLFKHRVADVIGPDLVDRLYARMQQVEDVTLLSFSQRWMRNVQSTKRVLGRSMENDMQQAKEREKRAKAEHEAEEE